jgi:ligand-binding sensor domain-containing protein
MLRYLSHVLPVLFLFSAGVMAITDSIDYGNNSMEWRRYDTDEPVVAFAENKGVLWYATATSVGAYAAKTNAKDVLTSMGSFSAQGVTDIAPDGRGGLWFVSPEGTAFTSDGKKFTNYTADNGFCDAGALRILVGNDGTVWAGTEKGVYSFKGGAWKAYTTADGLCGNKIRDIAASQKNVYFATNNGIAVYSSGKFSRYDKTTGLSSNDIRAISWDDRKGEIWAAAGESDINTFDGKSWNVFMDIQDGILCIMSDSQSRIWVGSSSGFIKYNGVEWIYDSAKMPFAAAQCSRMQKDDNGNLWFAIESGVIKLNNPYPY